jgi:hypothetical protein
MEYAGLFNFDVGERLSQVRQLFMHIPSVTDVVDFTRIIHA